MCPCACSSVCNGDLWGLTLQSYVDPVLLYEISSVIMVQIPGPDCAALSLAAMALSPILLSHLILARGC